MATIIAKTVTELAAYAECFCVVPDDPNYEP
jgi:hypothetical protein